jgi:hypothetical protein
VEAHVRKERGTGALLAGLLHVVEVKVCTAEGEDERARAKPVTAPIR